MADATSQNGSGNGDSNQDPSKGGAGSVTTTTADVFDPTKLSEDQINQIMEKNPNFWNSSRLKELRDDSAQFKKLQKQQDADRETSLTEQKKFEELAQKRADELGKANSRIQELQVNQALTNLLVKDNVVDLDGALKLVDRSKVTVGDDGTLSGVEDAFNALKSDKAYLFTGTAQPRVGNPSNPTQSSGGQTKFKESQLYEPGFYDAHKAEIDEAGRQGLIELDVTGAGNIKT